MWDTRSIIVRFRRQRGNTCLPGEQKTSPKKIKEETAKASASITNDSKARENHSKEVNDKSNQSFTNTNSLHTKSEKK